jgi:hypothetical protein
VSFKEQLLDEQLIREFLEEQDWAEDVKIEEADSNTALATIEHIRSEIETAGIVSITIWAALIGAIVGSVLTLVLSRLI